MKALKFISFFVLVFFIDINIGKAQEIKASRQNSDTLLAKPIKKNDSKSSEIKVFNVVNDKPAPVLPVSLPKIVEAERLNASPGNDPQKK